MLKTVSSITNAIGALNYKGTWNASTNTPALASGVGTKGDYYVVNVAGTTTLDGISNWGIGDWAVFNGTAWQRVEGGADLNGVNVSFTGTASGPTYETSNAAAGMTIANNDITADGTNPNIDINITPKGSGEVNLPKVDIDGGVIDATVIGGASPAAGSFTDFNSTLANQVFGKIYPQTGTDGVNTSIIDTGINFSFGESHVYLCIISGNPNQGGNGGYRANAAYLINISSDYTFSIPAPVVSIKETKLAFNTGAAGTELTLDAKFWDGATEADMFATWPVQIRLKVGPYNGAFIGADQVVRLIRLQ